MISQKGDHGWGECYFDNMCFQIKFFIYAHLFFELWQALNQVFPFPKCHLNGDITNLNKQSYVNQS